MKGKAYYKGFNLGTGLPELRAATQVVDINIALRMAVSARKYLRTGPVLVAIQTST